MQATEGTIERTRAGSLPESAVRPAGRGVAIAIAVTGGLLGILAGFILFVRGYHHLIQVELAAGRPDEAIIVTYVIPALTDLIISGGLLWLVAAYGLHLGARWGVPLAIVASVVSVAASFFPMVPAMSRSVFPAYVLIFVPNLAFFFLLLAYVRPTRTGRIVLGLLSGIACVLCFMNGVASIDKILVTGRAIFVPVQQITWLASLAWGVFTAGLLLYRPWVYPVGLAAGLGGAVSGLPLAYATTLEYGRFSLFSPAPLVSIGLLVYLLTRRGRDLVEGGRDLTRS